jgi:hypothetical protein
MEEVNRAGHQTCLPGMRRDKNDTRSVSSSKQANSSADKHAIDDPGVRSQLGYWQDLCLALL